MVKKLILSIGACLLGGAMMVTAAPVQQQQQFNDFKSNMPHRKAMKHLAAKLEDAPRVATRVDYTEVITSPQGEYKFYNKEISGWVYNDDGYQVKTSSASFATHVVFGSNNEVYFYDPVSCYAEDTYIKGELNNNVITVTLPQTISIQYYGGLEIIINAYLLQNTGLNNYQPSNISTITYNYDPTTQNITLNMPGEGEEYLFGYGMEYSTTTEWLGLGDFTQSFTLNTEVNTIPTGVVTEDYVIKLKDYGYPVEVGMDSENIYIKDIVSDCHGCVLIGKLNGNTATIASRQTIGNAYYFWAENSCYIEVSDQLYAAPEDAVYLLNVDTQNKIITVDSQQLIDGQTPYLGFASFADNFNIVIFDDDFSIYQQDSFFGIPSDPTNLQYDSFYAGYYRIPYIDVTLPGIGTNGNVLDMSNLYFRIYTDGSLYSFVPSFSSQASQYCDLPPGQNTEIPVWLNNYGSSYDIITTSAVDHIIGIDKSGVTRIGVQLVYYCNDIVTESGIVTLNITNGNVTTEPSNGIEGVEVSDIVSETYYDLNGRQVVNPDKGIYIKKSVLSDGTVKSVKVIK